jgi:hypothetical protein
MSTTPRSGSDYRTFLKAARALYPLGENEFVVVSREIYDSNDTVDSSYKLVSRTGALGSLRNPKIAVNPMFAIQWSEWRIA